LRFAQAARRMIQGGNDDNADAVQSQSRGPRLDLFIAICALLISSLGSAASWWQARLLNEQTRVLEAQLGAQVWPYVDVSQTIDNATVTFRVENNGLGPAVIRSETATVDGVPKSSMMAVLHATLGGQLVKHKLRGEAWHLALGGDSPGSVLRAGESTALLSFTSKQYAQPLIRASHRIAFGVCYCAIVPGQCWLSTSQGEDPRAMPTCHEIPSDLMHASAADELNGDF
jgi:hypothetical protein